MALLLFLPLFSYSSTIQNTPSMPFFDFHLHPTLKSLFSDNNAATGAKKLSPWTPIDKSKIPFLLRCCTEFSYILQSQGNLAELIGSDCNLVCIALYIPEKDMLTDDLIQSSSQRTLRCVPASRQNNQPYKRQPLPDITNRGLG